MAADDAPFLCRLKRARQRAIAERRFMREPLAVAFAASAIPLGTPACPKPPGAVPAAVPSAMEPAAPARPQAARPAASRHDASPPATDQRALASAEASPPAGPARRTWPRPVKLALTVVGAVLGLVVLGVGAAMIRLASGPVSLDFVTARVSAALERQFGDDFAVSVRHTELEPSPDGLSLAVSDIVVKDASGKVVVASPRALIGFDTLSLMSGAAPKRIEFLGLSVVLTVAPDGTVSVSADAPADRGEPAAADAAAVPGTPTVAFGMASLFDAVSDHSGPLGILEHAGIRDGRLTIHDQRRGVAVTYDDLSLGFGRPASGETAMTVRARGPLGPWRLSAAVAGLPGQERSASVEIRDLAISELLGFAQPGAVPVSTDMPLSGFAKIRIGADNRVAGLEGRITGGSAWVFIEDPDAEPINVESVQGEFGWDAGARAVQVRSLDFRTQGTHWALKGTVAPPDDGAEFWRVHLVSDGSALAGEGPEDQPIKVSDLVLDARVGLGLNAVIVDHLQIKGPETDIGASAEFGRFPDKDGLRLDVSVGRMPARAMLAFWPSFIGSDVRKYLIDNVIAGQIDQLTYHTQLTMTQLEQGLKRQPIPDEAALTRFSASQGSMTLLAGLPPVTDVRLEGVVTGRTTSMRVAKAAASFGPGRGLAFADGTMTIADMALNPPVAEIAFRLQGGADVFMEALRSEALKAFSPLQVEAQGLKGQIEARISFALPLHSVIKPQDLGLSAQGQFTGLSVDKLFGKEKLEGATIAFTQDKAGLSLKGEGKLGGLAATIDYRQAPGASAGEAVVAFVADDAARAKRGLKLPQATGPIGVKITAKDGTGAKTPPLVELDLTKTALSELIPGWTKPAGKAAKASFRLNDAGPGTRLDDFALEAAGGVAIKGSLDLAADGSLLSADLPVLKLGNDEMKVEFDRSGGVPKITVRAQSIDGRPFMKSLTSPGSGGPPSDADIDVKAGTLAGFNGENVVGFDMRLALRGGQIRDLRLGGRLGRSLLSGQMARAEAGGNVIVLESADAGAFLRFADIYRRMQGGALTLQLDVAANQFDGAMVIVDFALKNEPALQRVTGPTPPAGGDREASARQAQGDSVAFAKLKAPFSIKSGVVRLAETTLSGPSVGGVVEGTIDFNRDRMDLKGTFVPAYGLNNVFNRLPIVGALLGGGQNEGLFAVNFRVGGSFTQPVLSFNPLSAVAPGFLRKLFGAPRPESLPAEPALQ